MNEDQGYRQIGPDGTITLFKDLLRRLGEAGHDFHIGAPESHDNGEGDELTAETFRRITEAIVANELVALARAGEREDASHAGDFSCEAMSPHGRAVLGKVDIPANRLSGEEEKLLFDLMQRGGVPLGLRDAAGVALRRARL